MSEDIEVWADLSLPVRSDAVTSHSIGGTMGLLTGFSIIRGQPLSQAVSCSLDILYLIYIICRGGVGLMNVTEPMAMYQS